MLKEFGANDILNFKPDVTYASLFLSLNALSNLQGGVPTGSTEIGLHTIDKVVSVRNGCETVSK